VCSRYAAIPNHDSHEARIRVLPLHPSPREREQRDVVLPGLAELRGIHWLADGKGWVAAVRTSVA
jgi:hypothetical protein